MDMAAFALLAAALDGGKDAGAAMPILDATDFAQGAKYIPSEVTMARRNGEHVNYNKHDKNWTMPDGKIVS